MWTPSAFRGCRGKRASGPLQEGACIVTDTQMAYSGVSKPALAKLGGQAFCFMADEDVAQSARERGVTRAACCMEKAAALGKDCIIAVGNAPTALVRLYELMEEARSRPGSSSACLWGSSMWWRAKS